MAIDDAPIKLSFEFQDEIKKNEEAPATPKKRLPGRPSTKELNTNMTLQLPPDEELYSKQYYPIGEVALLFNENQSVIRHWENEFDILTPKKNKKGDRLFRPKDVKNLALIYDLIRNRKYTLEGAKDYLKKNTKSEDIFTALQSLERIKSFLLELKAQL